MNPLPPQVDPNAYYNLSETARLLGLSRSTLYRAVKLGPKNQGIASSRRRDNGRLQITGREILRYWKG